MPTEEQRRLLKDAPLNAQRVRCIDAEGKQRWRVVPGHEGPPERALLDTDRIDLNKDGKPIYMEGTPGRKKPVERKPKDALAATTVKDKASHMNSDPLMVAVSKDPESVDVLHATIKAIVTECTSLEFERKQRELAGEDTTMVSNRRIAALTKVGDTWLRRYDQITSKGFDMESSEFRTVFNFIMETVRGAMADSGISPDRVKLAFTKMGHTFSSEEWAAEARERMKKK